MRKLCIPIPFYYVSSNLCSYELINRINLQEKKGVYLRKNVWINSSAANKGFSVGR